MIDATWQTGVAAGAPSLRREFRSRARRHRVPVKAMLELTARCNLDCVHCYVADHSRPELPLERWVGLVSELADAGCFSVTLTGGEVGVRSGWLDVARAVKRRRMVLSILTSGTAFAGEDLRQLVELRPANVSVSVYGARAETHDAVTRVPGSFDKSVATLRSLVAAGIRCRVTSVLMKQTIAEFRGIAALAEELGCTFMFDPTVAPCDDGSCDVTALRVDAPQLHEFYLSEVMASRSREGRIARAGQEPPLKTIGNCDAGFTVLFVDAAGDVFPCMGFPPAFGDIRTASLASVWGGPMAEKHRAAMDAPLEHCSSCTLLRYCSSRCPRLAAVEDGDMSGPSRRACELAEMTADLRRRLHSVESDSHCYLEVTAK